jgi:three-Cys-motif partner protein
MKQKKTGSQNKAHNFGGPWTTTKLNILKGYLSAYTTALKNQPALTTAYIDAFAGTGYRSLSSEESPNELLFPDLAEKEPQEWLDGSAMIALKAEPRFNKYIFIEKNPARCTQLENLKTTFPDQANDIVIKQGDANEQIKKLCVEGWGTRRAVLFLDPYGTQVEWSTIEAIA